MRPILIIITLIIGISLGGCATGYQKMTAFTLSGGFSENNLGKDVWRVEFSANGYTNQETAQCYWLFRCAELALEQGFDGFEILSDIRLTKAVDPYEAFGVSGPQLQPVQYYVPIIIPTDNSSKPYIQADIRLIKGTINANPPKVFDARKLKEALDPHVSEPIKKRSNVKPHIHEYLMPPGKLTNPQA